jgi:hypothetical protein
MSKIEFRAFIPNIQSALKYGAESGRLTLEIPESDVQKSVGLIALKNLPLKITVEVDEGHQGARRVKEKPTKGEHGSYWQSMFKSDFHGIMLLWDVLDVKDALEVKDALRKAFEVESLSFVSPPTFEAWADKNNLPQLVTLSRQAAMKTVS